MERLITGTTAYKIFSSDVARGTLSHAYMLDFNDPFNLRSALKFFAYAFFGANAGTPLYSRLVSESHPDLIVYPSAGKKITADGAAEIIEGSSLKPVEAVRKLFVISGFDDSSAIVQNKLLKTLEEPPENVHYLLGVTSQSPVLTTVLSRVKLLKIPPFTSSEVLAALNRKAENPLNYAASNSCNGVLGVAENMVTGGWYEGVRAAAEEICNTLNMSEISAVAEKHGDTKYKRELLTEMGNIYFSALTSGGRLREVLSDHALIYALESVNRALADVKFNAFFKGLLYDFMLRVVKENEKWQKLQA